MWARIARSVWILGFSVGAVTHVLDLVAGGSDVYAGYPELVRIYWVSLTLLDPLAATMTALRMRAAVPLGVGIMVSDVAINAAVLVATGAFSIVALAMQLAFGLFVVMTAPLLWRASHRSRARRPRESRSPGGR